MNSKKNSIILHILMVFFVFTAIYPILIIFFNSFKTTSEIGLDAIGLPNSFNFDNYFKAWEVGQFGKTMKNSLILVTLTVILELILSGFAAYSISRIKPKGSNLFLFYLLVVSTIPIWLYIVPLFFTFRSLGLTNNLFGLVLIYTVMLHSAFFF